MDDPLISEVFERLDADATKTGATENLVLGALLGRLDDVIDGVVVERPVAATREESAPVHAYLESVAVTGFRGIGPTCELGLRPGPGLTLVVGRNGSGKSSIAEALEFALTGDSLRWAGKSLEWKNGWRNLHAQDNPAITVGLRVDGERELRTVRVNWSSRKLESAKTAVTVPGRGRQSLGSLGWSDAVRTFRPFLPYKELSTISEGRPIDRYNALAPMLGMETLQAPIENLRQARLSAERERTDAVEHVSQVTACYGGRPTSEPAPRWRRSLELGTSRRSRPSSRAPIPASPNGRVSSPRWNSFPRLTSTGSQQQQAVCGRPLSVRRHFGAATPSGLRGWPGCSKPQWRCTSSTATPIARSAAATTACTASASRNSGERSNGCAPKQAKFSPPAARHSVPNTRRVKPSGRFRKRWGQRRTQT